MLSSSLFTLDYLTIIHIDITQKRIHPQMYVFLFFLSLDYIRFGRLGLVFAPAIGGAGAGGQRNFSNPFLQNAHIA